jgi:hypothetical protein
MKKTTKIYKELPRNSPEINREKKQILQQESQQIIKTGPTKTSENFAALKNLGTTLINLNYYIYMM